MITPKDTDAEPFRGRQDTDELPSRAAASQRRAMQAAMTAAVMAMRSSGRRPRSRSRHDPPPTGRA